MDIVRRRELESSLRSSLQHVRDAVRAPGVAAGISIGGDRIQAAVGLADARRDTPWIETSRFGIACITKVLVAAVACLLESEGQLDLDAPLGDWLPQAAAGNDEITLRRLMSHTGGYQGPLMFGVSPRTFSWNAFEDAFASRRQVFAPGQVFNYENTGYVLVGEAIEKATGRPPMDIVAERIFSPLGITPGAPAQDFRAPERYVAPHHLDADRAAALAPPSFGPFWRSSLADISLTVDDLLAIGEALIGTHPSLDLSAPRKALEKRLVSVPSCVSGVHREHAPHHFTTLCAEYADGWFGSTGSASAQTCGFRFNPALGMVTVVAFNAWLPIARDALLDKLSRSRTHADAGQAGGNPHFDPAELVGDYEGGGNLLRRVTVSLSAGWLELAFTGEGLSGPPLQFDLDGRDLAPVDPAAITPAVGFFADPRTGAPSVFIGMSSLKKIGPSAAQ
jgi:CubicO group peptidase (beta-lactamase class C family)